jgi:hypothetical protein
MFPSIVGDEEEMTGGDQRAGAAPAVRARGRSVPGGADLREALEYRVGYAIPSPSLWVYPCPRLEPPATRHSPASQIKSFTTSATWALALKLQSEMAPSSPRRVIPATTCRLAHMVQHCEFAHEIETSISERKRSSVAADEVLFRKAQGVSA